MSALDKAAEAIWATNPASRAFFGYTWDNDLIPEDERDAYRRMAQAAIDALELTEQFTWSWPETLTTTGLPGYGFPVDTAKEARAEGEPYMTIVTRLVSPWRAEGGE